LKILRASVLDVFVSITCAPTGPLVFSDKERSSAFSLETHRGQSVLVRRVACLALQSFAVLSRELHPRIARLDAVTSFAVEAHMEKALWWGIVTSRSWKMSSGAATAAFLAMVARSWIH